MRILQFAYLVNHSGITVDSTGANPVELADNIGMETSTLTFALRSDRWFNYSGNSRVKVWSSCDPDAEPVDGTYMIVWNGRYYTLHQFYASNGSLMSVTVVSDPRFDYLETVAAGRPV